MKHLKTGYLAFLCLLIFNSCAEMKQAKKTVNTNDMMVRIAEIEIDPDYLDKYITILQEESEASIRIEPGVISIFPMFPKDNPTKIVIVEIYANKEAYESHLKTPHFLKYKTSTLNMVKSLKLIDMEAIDKEMMSKIFRKINP